MASQYDSIKTAEELLKEVAAHGLSSLRTFAERKTFSVAAK